jgi:hypothetical protein
MHAQHGRRMGLPDRRHQSAKPQQPPEDDGQPSPQRLRARFSTERKPAARTPDETSEHSIPLSLGARQSRPDVVASPPASGPRKLSQRAGACSDEARAIASTKRPETASGDRHATPPRLILAEGLRDVGDRCSLRVADGVLIAMLAVSVGDLVGEVDDEALVLVELLRCRLAVEQRHGVA